MQHRFDDESYWALLEGLGRTHRPLRFADIHGETGEKYFILRHDVDYSPAAALRLARLETSRGVRATYFLLVGSLYYSLLDPEHAGFPQQLVEMGHEVALHYDVNAFAALPRERWESVLRSQARLLEDLAGSPVRVIAMHQPGLNGVDLFRSASTGFVNAYDDAYFREMPYISDSCRAFRDKSWEMLTRGPLPERFQLVLHPINWARSDRGRTEIFEKVHREAASRLEGAEKVLLAQIARHEGVLEHEARERRSEAS